MKGRYEVSLGGVQLDSLDDNLLILDVGYSPLTKKEKSVTTANLNGFDTVETEYESRTVTITFELHIYDIAKRNEACQKVNAWANTPNSLVINDRKGQYLRMVRCQQFADIASAKNWTDPLTLVFTTERNPFFLSDTEKVSTIVGMNVNGTLQLDGNVAYSLIECEITAQAAVTSINIKVGDRTLGINGISLPVGKKLIVDYIKGRYLQIKANGVSVMDKLDPKSSDNLLAYCGQNTQVGIVANGRVSAKFKGRGCWI